jgi:hypothetical protein
MLFSHASTLLSWLEASSLAACCLMLQWRCRAILTSDTDPIEVWLVSTSHQSTADSHAGQGGAEPGPLQLQPQRQPAEPQQQQQSADSGADSQTQLRGGRPPPPPQQQQQQQAVQPRGLQQGGGAAGEGGGNPAGMTTPPPRQLSPLFKTEDRPQLITGAGLFAVLSGMLGAQKHHRHWVRHL